MLETFLLGFLSSIVATFLSAYIILLTSQKARWLITGILGRLSHHDIEFVFKNKKEAEKDYSEELKKSKKIYLIASRGNELQRGPFRELFNDKPQDRIIDFKVILPKTNLKNNEFNFITQRECEISKFDKVFRENSGMLTQQINLNIDYLTNIKLVDDTFGFSLTLANIPHFARILLTDEYLYFEPYNKNRHGSQDPVLKFKRGETYNAFNRYFDLIWSSEKEEF